MLLVANNAADPPFATLVDTQTRTIVTKITFNGANADGHNAPNATNGIEQAVWDPSHGGRFFISIPQLNGGGPGGVAMIDPLTGNVTKVYERGVSLYDKEDDAIVRRILGSLRCVDRR